MTERMIDMIQKLLAMAEGGATEGERSAHLAKAQELMVRYAVDEAMLQSSGKKTTEQVVSREFFREDKTTPLIKAKRELLGGLAGLNRCRAILLHRRVAFVIVGHQSDVDFVSQMFTSILLQLQTDMMAAERRSEAITKGWRVSYAHGYVRRVYARLKAINDATMRDTRASTPGTDLVLVDRSAVVNRQVDNMFGKLSSSRMSDSSRSSFDGYRKGDEAGKFADIGQTPLGGSTRAQIG